MSYRKIIVWRQKSYHWTDSEWPSDYGAKWTATVVALQLSIRLKANHIKLKITSGKSIIFGHFFKKYFKVTCVHICISLNTNDIAPILHTCLTWCWSCLCSTAGYLVFLLGFLVPRVKKKKNKSIKLVSREGNFFLKIWVLPFLWQSLIDNKWYSSHKLSEYLGYGIICCLR